MTRYVLHICCLDNHISCTTSGWENEVLQLAQAQCLMHTTCRTQEGISRNFGKNLASIQQRSINSILSFMCGKNHRLSLTTATNFLTGLLIGLVGSNLALLAAGFSSESYFLPCLLQTQRNRSTTRTKVESIWAKSHLKRSCLQSHWINGFANASLQGTLWRTPFRTEMVSKEWLTYELDTF